MNVNTLKTQFKVLYTVMFTNCMKSTLHILVSHMAGPFFNIRKKRSGSETTYILHSFGFP